MFEHRRHFRLRDYFEVDWKIDGKDNAGEGVVLNISTSGVLLQTHSPLKVSDQCVIEIQPSVGSQLPFSPKKGKIVWFRKISDQGRYQCGVEFLKDAGLMDRNLRNWIEEKVASMSEGANVNILNNYVV